MAKILFLAGDSGVQWQTHKAVYKKNVFHILSKNVIYNMPKFYIILSQKIIFSWMCFLLKKIGTSKLLSITKCFRMYDFQCKLLFLPEFYCLLHWCVSAVVTCSCHWGKQSFHCLQIIVYKWFLLKLNKKY